MIVSVLLLLFFNIGITMFFFRGRYCNFDITFVSGHEDLNGQWFHFSLPRAAFLYFACYNE